MLDIAIGVLLVTSSVTVVILGMVVEVGVRLDSVIVKSVVARGNDELSRVGTSDVDRRVTELDSGEGDGIVVSCGSLVKDELRMNSGLSELVAKLEKLGELERGRVVISELGVG